MNTSSVIAASNHKTTPSPLMGEDRAEGENLFILETRFTLPPTPSPQGRGDILLESTRAQ